MVLFLSLPWWDLTLASRSWPFLSCLVLSCLVLLGLCHLCLGGLYLCLCRGAHFPFFFALVGFVFVFFLCYLVISCVVLCCVVLSCLVLSWRGGSLLAKAKTTQIKRTKARQRQDNTQERSPRQGQRQRRRQEIF